MNDIELLEHFRADVPEPSTDAWLRARATLEAAKQEALIGASDFVNARSLRRARRRPARWRLAGIGLAGVAAGTALVLALTGLFGTTPNPRTGGMRPPTQSSTSIRTLGFVLTADGNGTLTLTMSQVLDPTALQQALVQHGVPSLVETATYCTSNPAAPDPFSIGVLTTTPPISLPAPGQPSLVPAPAGSTPPTLGANTTTVIHPAAMPAGTELFFDYAPADNLVAPNLIYANSYTCSAAIPSVQPKD